MSEREIYVEKQRAQLRKIEAEIDQLEAEARSKAADARVAALSQIEGLKQKRELLDKQVEELNSAADDAWETAKGTVESTWNDLRAALGRAV